MKRAILAFLAGLVTWVLVVSVLDRILRLTIEGYAAGEPTMTFTLGMMTARLTIAIITSVVAGAVVGWIAKSNTRVAWVLGVVLVAVFIPSHVHFYDRFPIWYHLTFLVTLAPLIAAGSWLALRPQSSGKLVGVG